MSEESTTSTPLVVNSGEASMVTFDQLEEITSKPKTDSIKKEAVKSAAKEMVSKKEPKEEKGEKDSKHIENAKGKTEKAQAQEKARKLLKAKIAKADAEGEFDEIEIDEDAKFSHKVAGQDVEVSARELLNNYSGKVHYDKKFNELDHERRSFHKERSTLESNLKEILEVGKTDPEMAYFKFAQSFGHNPTELRQKLYDAFAPSLEKWHGMTEDERKASQLEFENKMLKSQVESARKKDDAAAQEQELEAKITKLRETHNISKEDYIQYYDTLGKLVQAGKLKEVTPEIIAETAVKDRLWLAMEEALGGTQAKFETEQQKAEILFKLTNMGYQNGLDPNDMADIVKDMFADKKTSKALLEKVEESKRERGESKRETQSAPSKGTTFFDDL